MAGRIQGITVEIGGDTTKLSDALKGVNKEIRGTQSQLKDVEKLLKLDPSNTELLAQRQRLLNEEVEKTKEKLEALKSASIQANEALEAGTIGISDLGESYKYVAPLAQSMGLTIEDVTTALSAMSMAGIKGSQAGTSLRTVLANLTKPSDTVANAMEKLNVSITNSDGSFKSLDEILTTMRSSFANLNDDQQAYYATALAGKEGMSGLLSILNLTQTEYDVLSDSMKNCSGVAGETASVMQDNLQSKTEQLGGALESLAIQLSQYVIPFLIDLVVWITSLIEAFTNLNPMVQKVILFLAGLIAILSPLLIVIGKVVGFVGTVMTLLPKLTGLLTTVKTAFAAFNAVLLANPIGLVIVAVTALVAAFIYLWNNCGEFRQFWMDLWEKLKGALKSAVDFIENHALKAFQNLWNGIKEKVGGIKTSITSGFDEAVSYIRNLIKSAYTWGADLIGGIVDGIKSCIGKVKSAVTNVADTIRSFLHFAVPDVGPLTDYESWMPDFMKGLAEGIDKSKYLVTRTVDGLASDMIINPQVTDMESRFVTPSDSSVTREGLDGITSAITEAFHLANDSHRDIVIPIYLGGTMLDEVVVNAQQRTNLRSGGR